MVAPPFDSFPIVMRLGYGSTFNMVVYGCCSACDVISAIFVGGFADGSITLPA